MNRWPGTKKVDADMEKMRRENDADMETMRLGSLNRLLDRSARFGKDCGDGHASENVASPRFVDLSSSSLENVAKPCHDECVNNMTRFRRLKPTIARYETAKRKKKLLAKR